MPAVVDDKDDQYVLNHCTRFLARAGDERRHDFGQYTADDPRGQICEAWRYPIVDSYFDGTAVDASYAYNRSRSCSTTDARGHASSPRAVRFRSASPGGNASCWDGSSRTCCRSA